jgi:hypothetical protein
VTCKLLQIAPPKAPGHEQVKFLPQQLLLTVPEQLFSLSIDPYYPAICAQNDHGIRGGHKQLID